MRDLYVFRWLRHWIWRVLRKIVHPHATAHDIALGTAIGVFIGLTPTVGLQMVIGVFIATLIGVSRIAAALPAWITNPVTIIPIYTFNYWVGTLLIPNAPDIERFRNELTQIREISMNGSFGSALMAILELGVDILVPLWIGCVLVGLVAALPTYPIMLRVVRRFREVISHKRHARQQRVDKRMEETSLLLRRKLDEDEKLRQRQDQPTTDNGQGDTPDDAPANDRQEPHDHITSSS